MDLTLAISLLALFCSLLALGYVTLSDPSKKPKAAPEDSENVYSSKKAQKKAKAGGTEAKKPEITREALRRATEDIDNFRK